MNEIDRKILDILLEEKKPVSSRGLALRCDVSINTIRKEIGIFNEEVKGRGFCIASKTAVGHYLEIWDHRLAEPYIREKQLPAQSAHRESLFGRSLVYTAQMPVFRGSSDSGGVLR